MQGRTTGESLELAREPRPLALAAIALFLALGAAGVLRHEMWRDEVQAWLIAHASASLTDLFRNVRLETHPALWHLSLWLLTRVTDSLRAFQFYHLALAATGVFLLWRLSPFRPVEKLLLSFGYFSLFEYGLVARTYVMGVVLVYAFCAAYSRRRRGLPALFLFLLTQTSLHGAILACGLAIFAAMEAAEPEAEGRRGPRPVPILLATGLGVALTGIQVSTAYGPNRYQPDPISSGRILQVLEAIERSFLPIPNPAGRPVWGSNIVVDALRAAGLGGDLTFALTSAISLALLVLASAALWRRPRALAFYLSTSAMLLIFGYVVFQGAIRHQGHLFIAFVAALWLARSTASEKNERPAAPRIARWTILAIFAAQAAGGLLAWGLDIARPFSQAPRAAALIREERLDTLPIFGDRAPPASSLQPYLERPITYLADGRRGGFILWGPAIWPKKPDPRRMWSNLLRETLDAPYEEAILILNYPVERQPPPFRIQEIERFTGSLVGDEDFFLYAVSWKR